MGTFENLMLVSLTLSSANLDLPNEIEKNSTTNLPSPVTMNKDFQVKDILKDTDEERTSATIDFSIINGYKISEEDIILDFAKKLMDGMQEPDPEFSRIVNENFWDMV